jgi:hypothetical protein
MAVGSGDKLCNTVTGTMKAGSGRKLKLKLPLVPHIRPQRDQASLQVSIERAGVAAADSRVKETAARLLALLHVDTNKTA